MRSYLPIYVTSSRLFLVKLFEYGLTYIIIENKLALYIFLNTSSKTLSQAILLHLLEYQQQNPVSSHITTSSWIPATKPCLKLYYYIFLNTSNKTLPQVILLHLLEYQQQNPVSSHITTSTWIPATKLCLKPY